MLRGVHLLVLGVLLLAPSGGTMEPCQAERFTSPRPGTDAGASMSLLEEMLTWIHVPPAQIPPQLPQCSPASPRLGDEWSGIFQLQPATRPDLPIITIVWQDIGHVGYSALRQAIQHGLVRFYLTGPDGLFTEVAGEMFDLGPKLFQVLYTPMFWVSIPDIDLEGELDWVVLARQCSGVGFYDGTANIGLVYAGIGKALRTGPGEDGCYESWPGCG